MFYFTERVIELKAWQLYLGNAFWTLFIGIIILVIAKVLGIIGLESETTHALLQRFGRITASRDPEFITSPVHPHATAGTHPENYQNY